MLGKQPGRRFEDGGGIAQRPERIIQPKKKRQPLFVRAQLGLRLVVLERRPDRSATSCASAISSGVHRRGERL